MRNSSLVLRDTFSFLSAIVLCVVLAGLTGCFKKPAPSPPPENRGIPYTVDGITYYPLLSADNYVEQGTASWYGPGFHGRRTSTGERYNMYTATAAHRILPFGALVQVTNLANRRTTLVRINDRGPFKDNRIIDLSYKGAQEIAMIGPGTAPVEIKVVGIDRAHAAGEKEIHIPWSNRFAIQVGAFERKENALQVKTKLSTGYPQKVYVTSDVQDNGLRHRVRVGPYGSLKETIRVQEQLRLAGYTNSFMVAE